MTTQLCHRCGNAWPEACECTVPPIAVLPVVECNRFGEELTGDDALIVGAARILQRGITTRSENDALSVLQRRLEAGSRALAKLARIRKLVTYDTLLLGEAQNTPRFVVKGCEVLKVLEEP